MNPNEVRSQLSIILTAALIMANTTKSKKDDHLVRLLYNILNDDDLFGDLLIVLGKAGS
jgi:hypothetical protein